MAVGPHVDCGCASQPGACPAAEAACAELLALPLYPSLPLAAVDRVVERVRGCYR